MPGVTVTDIPTQPLGKTPLGGKRERAPAEGVKESDNPEQPFDRVPSGGTRERTPVNQGEGLGYSCPIFWTRPWGCVEGHLGYW